MLLAQERDTSDVWRQFAIWLLVGPDDGVLRFTEAGSLQYKAINRVADLYINDCKDVDAWQKAGAKAAYYGSYVYADYAAWHASQAAACAACAAGAPYAARASYAASYAAAAAEAAAYAAAGAHAADDAAWSAAKAAHYERMADKLIELLQAAPLKETK